MNNTLGLLLPAGLSANNVQQASTGAGNIAAAIGEVASGANDLAKNAGEAAKGVGEVAESIQGVSAMVSEMDGNTRQMSDSANSLLEVSGRLQKLVEGFKLRADEGPRCSVPDYASP